ncbi:MAG TPA: TfoX/Sxy family protein [Roseiarcus sp.]
MDSDGLKALFEPFAAVAVRRMFGGAGVYAGGLCFAIESGGEVFLKVDSLSQPTFAEAGSSPFVYVARGKPMRPRTGAFQRPPTKRPTSCAAGRRLGWKRRDARLGGAKGKPKASPRRATSRRKSK